MTFKSGFYQGLAFSMIFIVNIIKLWIEDFIIWFFGFLSVIAVFYKLHTKRSFVNTTFFGFLTGFGTGYMILDLLKFTGKF